MINIKRFSLICIFAVIIIFTGCMEQEEYYQTDNSIEAELTPVNLRRFEQTPQLRQPTLEEAEKYPQLTNLPTLYIELEIIRWDQIQRSVYVPAVYTLVDGEEGIFNEPLMIMGRGKFSWSLPKKPYTVRMARDIDLLGMKSARKWVLLAESYVDTTMMRHNLMFWLADEADQEYAPDWRYVDLYANGEYQGTYLITESIQIHENRLNLDRNTEAIFEIEATYRCADHEWCIDMIGGQHHIWYKRPSVKGSFSYDAKSANFEKFKEFFVDMQASLSQGYEAYSQFIDVDSFVSWYIVNEFCKNFDSGFTASCYAYLRDGKLYMGPVWDYHTAFGNQDIGPPVNKLSPEGYHVSSSPWFRILTGDDDFMKLVHAKWTQMRDDGIFERFIGFINETAQHISESAQLNFERWPDALRYTLRPRRLARFTFESEVEYLKDWIAWRIEWLDGEWYGR